SLNVAIALTRETVDGFRLLYNGAGLFVDLTNPKSGGSLRDHGKLPVAVRECSIVLELSALRQLDPVRGCPFTATGANEDLDPALALVTRLAEGIQVLPVAPPHVCETFEALVVLCQGGRQSGTANETGVFIILRNETTEQPIEVFHRLHEAEHLAISVVDAD